MNGNRLRNVACLILGLVSLPVMTRAAEQQDPPALAGESPISLMWYAVNGGGCMSASDDLLLVGSAGALDTGDPLSGVFDIPADAWTPDQGSESSALPLELALAPISPNPNRGSASLAWSLPAVARVRLTVHDVMGREVAVLADGFQDAGRHQATWTSGGDAGVVPGIYFVRLQTSLGVLVRRMVVTP